MFAIPLVATMAGAYAHATTSAAAVGSRYNKEPPVKRLGERNEIRQPGGVKLVHAERAKVTLVEAHPIDFSGRGPKPALREYHAMRGIHDRARHSEQTHGTLKLPLTNHATTRFLRKTQYSARVWDKVDWNAVHANALDLRVHPPQSKPINNTGWAMFNPSRNTRGHIRRAIRSTSATSEPFGRLHG